ncbi:Uncharacterised protein [BD1-7 clade bacterium]|uniref:SSD domain-containing protein n=1 Tax=BD1-7 clade bacterium TaxID=2029982 RepID=A0A5S9QY53_9GAMM|nr:Uncharacterised protein [BD1-7 clade bacterium]
MTNRLVQLTIQYRWLLFVLSLVVTGLAVTGLSMFKFDASVRSYFSPGYQYYEDFTHIEDTYGRESTALIMISPENGEVFTPGFLQALATLTDSAWTLMAVGRVDSIANYQHTFVEDDDLMVEDLIPLDEPITAERAAAISQIVVNEPTLINKLISADGKHVAVAINFTVDENDNAQSQSVVEALYEFAEDFEQGYEAETGQALDIAVTGNVVSIYHNIQIAKYDFGVMVPLMFLLMFVMLGLIMRTVAGTFIALLIAVMSAVGAFGLGSYFGITFAMMSFNGIIIIITVTVAHCIHILKHYMQEYDGTNKLEALTNSLVINALPVSLTSLTTLLGFLSLNFSKLPPVTSLGNVSAIGVVLCWMFSFTILPALALLLPFRPQKIHGSVLDPIMGKVADGVIANKGKILLGSGLLSIVMLALASQNIINDRFSELIRKPHEFRTDNEKVDRHFGALYDINLSMNAGESGGITDPAYLASMDKYATWLRAQPEVKSVTTIADTLKRLNQNLNGDDAAFYKVPEERELAAQYLLMYEMSLPFGLDLNNQIELNKEESRIRVTFASMDTTAVFDIVGRMLKWQEDNLPLAHQATPASVAVMWAHLSYDSLLSSIASSFMALLLISAIMVVALKSFKYGVISLVPNVFPAAFGFGVWYLISGEINMGLTAVMIITIGIVVDDTVHFLSKYKHARETLQQSTEDAVRYAFKTVGAAIVITTMVLVTGFSLLTISQAESNVNLGIMTAAILTSALILDFLLLPVLLLFLDGNKQPALEPAAAR